MFNEVAATADAIKSRADAMRKLPLMAEITPAVHKTSAPNKPSLDGGIDPRNAGSHRALNPQTASTGNPHVASTRNLWSSQCGKSGASAAIAKYPATAALDSSRIRNPTVDAMT